MVVTDYPEESDVEVNESSASRGRGQGQERKMQCGSGCVSLVGAATCIIFVATKRLL